MLKYLSNEKLEPSPTSLLRGILLVLNYFVGYLYFYPRLAVILTLWINPQVSSINPWIEFGIYLWMLGFSVALAYPEIKRSIKKLPSFTRWLRGIVLMFFSLYLVSIVCSLLATYLSGTTDSVNQASVIQSLGSRTLLTLFITIIYAPIVEEIVFRGVLFRGLRHRFNFIIAGLISGLSFGSIHIMDSLASGNFNDAWFLLVYAGLGIFFCFAYEKDDSIVSSWMLHLINNSISIVLVLM